jgi:hypothetical protein
MIEFSACEGNYFSRVLKDSVSPDGVRLTTLIARFPRFILAELNTHRVLSRNSASSRAIPTERLIEAVRTKPYIPETFNARVKGMGIGEELDFTSCESARLAWFNAAQAFADWASVLAKIGIDKSRANRLLEPFMWHTAIVSSTEWSNMLGLRCPPGNYPDRDFPAQWEFQQLAILIRNCLKESEPEELEYGDWAIPLIHPVDFKSLPGTSNQKIEALKKISARQLARVSFDTHTQSEPISVSITKSNELSASAHFSPFEHIARPISPDDCFSEKFDDKIMIPVSSLTRTTELFQDRMLSRNVSKMWCGNLRGWVQMRKEFDNEDDHLKALELIDA